MCDEKKIKIDRLLSAIRADDPEAIRNAVQTGIDLNSTEYFHGYMDNIYYGNPLYYAIAQETFRAVECLLDLGADWKVIGNYNLNKACYEPEILQLLIDRGADVNFNYGYGTVLHILATEKGNPKAADYWPKFSQSLDILRRAGAWINIRDEEGKTPLHCACEWWNQDMVEVLVHRFGATCDLEDNSGRTPWDYALLERNPSWRTGIIDMLIRSGPLINLNGRRRDNWTYLHDAVLLYPPGGEGREQLLHDKEGILALLRYMLFEKKVDVDPQGLEHNITPLGWIAMNSRHRPTTAVDVIKLLLEAGADPRMKVGPGKDQPLVEMVLRNEKNVVHPEVIELFKQFG